MISVMGVRYSEQRSGLFALTFVTAVIHGHNPTKVYFDQDKTRPHLIESLQKMEPSMFPVEKTQRRRKETLKCIAIPVYLQTSKFRKSNG